MYRATFALYLLNYSPPDLAL